MLCEMLLNILYWDIIYTCCYFQIWNNIMLETSWERDSFGKKLSRVLFITFQYFRANGKIFASFGKNFASVVFEKFYCSIYIQHAIAIATFYFDGLLTAGPRGPNGWRRITETINHHRERLTDLCVRHPHLTAPAKDKFPCLDPLVTRGSRSFYTRPWNPIKKNVTFIWYIVYSFTIPISISYHLLGSAVYFQKSLLKKTKTRLAESYIEQITASSFKLRKMCWFSKLGRRSVSIGLVNQSDFEKILFFFLDFTRRINID